MGDSRAETELRHAARSLSQPLKELDGALAADRLDGAAVSAARRQLAFIRFQLARLEASIAADDGM